METPIPRFLIPRSLSVDDLAALDREYNRNFEEEISNFANTENSPEGTDENVN
jgi:hypothetical protein